MTNTFIQKTIFRIKYATLFQRCLFILSITIVILFGLLIPSAHQDLSSILNKPFTITTPSREESQDPDAKGQDFYQHLPNQFQVKEILADFYKVAEEEGLEVPTVRYTLDETHDVSFSGYKLSAPVYGEYLHIMNLIQIMVENHPSLALTKVRFLREDQKNNLISAEIELVIFMKKDN